MTVNKDEIAAIEHEFRNVKNLSGNVRDAVRVFDAKEETIRQLRQDNTALRDCLAWYADALNYVQRYQPDGPFKFKSAIDEDRNGNRARTLLAELDRKDTQPKEAQCNG